MESNRVNSVEECLELRIRFDKRGGFVPAIAQDYSTGEVLIVAYANQQALEESVRTGYATFWSTSRNELWTKGLTSGDMLRVMEILTDCDQDALLYRVERVKGGACHTINSNGCARASCFYRRINQDTMALEFLDGRK